MERISLALNAHIAKVKEGIVNLQEREEQLQEELISTYEALTAPDLKNLKNFPAILPEVVPGFGLQKAEAVVNLAESIISQSFVVEQKEHQSQIDKNENDMHASLAVSFIDSDNSKPAVADQQVLKQIAKRTQLTDATCIGDLVWANAKYQFMMDDFEEEEFYKKLSDQDKQLVIELREA